MDAFTLPRDGHNMQEAEEEIKEGLEENGQREEKCDWEDGVADEDSDEETDIFYSGESKAEDFDDANLQF